MGGLCWDCGRWFGVEVLFFLSIGFIGFLNFHCRQADGWIWILDHQGLVLWDGGKAIGKEEILVVVLGEIPHPNEPFMLLDGSCQFLVADVILGLWVSFHGTEFVVASVGEPSFVRETIGPTNAPFAILHLVKSPGALHGLLDFFSLMVFFLVVLFSFLFALAISLLGNSTLYCRVGWGLENWVKLGMGSMESCTTWVRWTNWTIAS